MMEKIIEKLHTLRCKEEYGPKIEVLVELLEEKLKMDLLQSVKQ